MNVFETLAKDYPVVYLNPDTDSKADYRAVVLNGEDPGKNDLSHYRGSKYDRLENEDTPVGPVRVLTLGNRQDFELILRGFMAAKKGPEDRIPKSQGASMLTVINWARINSALSGLEGEERQEAFEKFTSVKANYLEMLVVLSRGPYSNVSADRLSLKEEDWLDASDTIRRYHELTHVVMRRKYPEDINAIRDELIADAVGLYAAFKAFDPQIEKIFLGTEGDEYTGGRLENYTDDPGSCVKQVNRVLETMKECIEKEKPQDPFDLIEKLINCTNLSF